MFRPALTLALTLAAVAPKLPPAAPRIERLEPRTLLASVAGTLDVSFDGDGRLTWPLPADEFGGLFDTVVQPDGKVVVAGQVGKPEEFKLFVARFLEDGTPDPTFGGNGFAYAPWASVNGGGMFPGALLLQNDGKIVLAGTTSLPNDQDTAAIARFRADGVLDGTFGGGDGHEYLNFYSRGGAGSIAVQPDGKFVLGGWGDGPANDFRDVAIIRCMPDGRVDPSFGAGGS